jgi:hypothetical protein
MLTDSGLDSREDSVHIERPTAADIVTEYFELLRQSPAHFIKRADSKGHNFFVVDFKSIRQHMKRKLFDKLLKSRFGNSTCRIARILIEKGKLEEKQASVNYVDTSGLYQQFLTFIFPTGAKNGHVTSKGYARKASLAMYPWHL